MSTSSRRRIGVRDVWPRRASAPNRLPPGQREIRAFPRFADNPRIALPKLPPEPAITVAGAVTNQIEIELGDLDALDRVEATHDFHCVTTWTHRGLAWSGFPFTRFWADIVVPRAHPSPDASHLVIAGLDGYQAVLALEDALGQDVLLADTLSGVPLCLTHGAPVRFLSPHQYGYKSVKHVARIDVYTEPPPLGAKEHLRARVELEERHSRLPAWCLRWPYRLVVVPTALIAERSARRSGATEST